MTDPTIKLRDRISAVTAPFRCHSECGTSFLKPPCADCLAWSLLAADILIEKSPKTAAYIASTEPELER